MVHTIAPVVYGSHRSQQRAWLPAIMAHGTALMIGAILTGGLLGQLGRFAAVAAFRTTWSVGLFGVVSLIYALHELRFLKLPYPEWRRQVPANWRYQFHPYVTAALFGAQLGVGFLTFVPVTTLYVVAFATVVSASPVTGVVLFGCFGAGRAGLLALIARRVRTHSRAMKTVNILIATKPLVHLLNGWLLAMIGGCLLMTFWLQAGN